MPKTNNSFDLKFSLKSKGHEILYVISISWLESASGILFIKFSILFSKPLELSFLFHLSDIKGTSLK